MFPIGFAHFAWTNMRGFVLLHHPPMRPAIASLHVRAQRRSTLRVRWVNLSCTKKVGGYELQQETLFWSDEFRKFHRKNREQEVFVFHFMVVLMCMVSALVHEKKYLKSKVVLSLHTQKCQCQSSLLVLERWLFGPWRPLRSSRGEVFLSFKKHFFWVAVWCVCKN